MEKDLEKINKHLIEILGPERGYFGRIDTWGQKPEKYEYIGYELTEDFLPTLKKMSKKERRSLVKIMNYFEIHAHPLKNLLSAKEEYHLYKFYSDISWSQFMTVVMFGMLEVAVKSQPGAKLNQYGSLSPKGKQIKRFLKNNLPNKIKKDIADRYKTEEVFGHKKEIKTFSGVVDHLWHQIRSGFVHDAGIEARGLEWSTFDGIGTKEEPLTVRSDVPMQELLQVTWQAILNSFGYQGSLKLPQNKRPV